VVDAVDDIVAWSPALVRRTLKGLLFFFEWGGVLLWAWAAGLTAAGWAAWGWRGALVGAAIGLPPLLWQRPPPGPLSRLPVAWQRAYLASLGASRFFYRRMGLKVLAAIVMTAYYGQPEMQRALGYDIDARVVWSRAEPNPGSRLDGKGAPSGTEIPHDRDDAPPAERAS
jgi:hypothetical protein